jgi:hypothetical protein
VLLILAIFSFPVFWYPGCVTAPRLPLIEQYEFSSDGSGRRIKQFNVGLLGRNWDAPFAFVAIAERVRFVGLPVEGFDGYQLVEVTASVENVVRGKLQAGRVRCYYYIPRGGFNGQTSEVVQGRRYAYFMRLQQGVLRSNADPWATAAEIGSGRHRMLPLPEPSPVGRQVAALTLTPGENINPKRFASGILDNPLLGAIGRWERVLLLRKLLEHQFPEVRIAACTALTRDWGHDDCWDDLEFAATTWMPLPYLSTRNRLTERADRRFTADPDTWWEDNAEAHRAAGLEQDLLDQLRTLATHKDQRIARAYCPLLNKHYPQDSVDGCPAPERQ